MAALLEHIDPDGLEEFSVVFTDRSLNHMSKSFQQVMNDISSMLQRYMPQTRLFLSLVEEPTGWRLLRVSLGRMLKCSWSKWMVFYRWSQIFEATTDATM